MTGETTKIDVEYLVTDLSKDQLKAEYNVNKLQEFLFTGSQDDTAAPLIQKIEDYQQNRVDIQK